MTSCDQCGHASLTFVYEPDGSTRGLKNYLCRYCGLVQSLPRTDRTQERHGMAVSSGADWGNVRYGKGFRTTQAMDALSPFISWDAALKILDVGSNRGKFASAFLEKAKNATMIAVKP